MDSSDHKALNHPQKYTINNGELILVVLCKEQPVAVCALKWYYKHPG